MRSDGDIRMDDFAVGFNGWKLLEQRFNFCPISEENEADIVVTAQRKLRAFNHAARRVVSSHGIECDCESGGQFSLFMYNYLFTFAVVTWRPL